MLEQTTARQVIGKAERVPVLDHFVLVGDDAQGGGIGTAEIDLVAGDGSIILGADIFLDDFPIQTGIDQRVSGGWSLLDFGTQAVPGLLADVEQVSTLADIFVFLLK